MKLGENGRPQTAEMSGKCHIPAWNQLDSFCSVLADPSWSCPKSCTRGGSCREVGFLGSSQEGVLSVEDSEHPMGLSVQESAACSQGREGGV